MDWVEIKNEKPVAEGLYLVEGHYVTDIRENDEDFLFNTSLFRGYRVAYWDGDTWWSEDYCDYYALPSPEVVYKWLKEPLQLFTVDVRKIVKEREEFIVKLEKFEELVGEMTDMGWR